MKKPPVALNESEELFYQTWLLAGANRLSKPIAAFDSVEWRWADWGKDSARMGQFAPFKNCIYLSRRAGNLLPKMLLPTVVHELRHKWQRKKFGWLFWLLAIPIVRRFTIERDALALEAEADEIWG